jgi:hypothetical protein
VVADSGNGCHLLYRVNLANDEATTQLMKRVLEALSHRFSDAKVEIDIKPHNAARICKLYGTLACKGDNVAGRPHRLAQIIKQPEVLEVIPRELLEQFVAEHAQQANNVVTSVDPAAVDELRVWLTTHGVEIKDHLPYKDRYRFQLKHCVFNEDHLDAAVFLNAAGRPGYNCFHNSCAEKHWSDVRQLLEPEAERSRKTSSRGIAAKQAEPAAEEPEQEAEAAAPGPDHEIAEHLLGVLRRYIVAEEVQLHVLTVWILHTHCFLETGSFTPYMVIKSAESGSGKTRVLEVCKWVELLSE